MNFIDIGRSVLLEKCTSHKHDVWEIELNLSGSGINNVEGQAVSFSEGTLICLPPKFSHGKKADTSFKDTFIHCKTLNIPNTNSYTLINDDDGRIRALYSVLYDTFKKEAPNYKEISEQLFLALEQMIIGKLANTIGDTRVENLKGTIADNFNDPDFSVKDLYKKSGYCDDHLRRLFRKETGMSMLEYLTELRINHAKRLLSENHLFHYSIAEIGAMCGFYDISYFSRVFKKKTGLAPSEFKA